MTEPIRTDCKPPLARLIWPGLPCPALPCPLESRSTLHPSVGSHTLLAVPSSLSSAWLHDRVRIRFFAFGFSLLLPLRRRQISDCQSLVRPHPGYRPRWVPSADACRAWVSAPVSHPAAIVAARPTRHDPQAASPSLCCLPILTQLPSSHIDSSSSSSLAVPWLAWPVLFWLTPCCVPSPPSCIAVHIPS